MKKSLSNFFQTFFTFLLFCQTNLLYLYSETQITYFMMIYKLNTYYGQHREQKLFTDRDFATSYAKDLISSDDEITEVWLREWATMKQTPEMMIICANTCLYDESGKYTFE